MTDPALGSIAADFRVLRAAYPTYTNLPPHISRYMDALNEGLQPGQPRNTPCCFQMSAALNGAGAEHRIPPQSHRRRTARLNGDYYLGAVDELEVHLTGRYGRGEDLRGLLGQGATPRQMRAHLAGRQGILCFRDRGYGFHTELWDGADIVQNGAPGTNGARISASHCFVQLRVLFWPCTGDDGLDPLPDWLTGWWQVQDFETTWYYISDQRVVTWTRRAPAAERERPMRQRIAEGRVALDARSGEVTITWNDAGDGVSHEVLTPAPGQSGRLVGRTNNLVALEATRVTFSAPAPARRPGAHHR